MIDYTDVAGLIPHSGRMVLLDRVLEFSEDSLVAELIVRNDGLFSDEGVIPAWVGIEYMAQTVGAYSGIKSKLAGKPIKLGYLLGTRRYNSNVASFEAGTNLTVRVRVIIQDERLGVFDCLIRGQGVEVTANLNVYQPPSENKVEAER